MNEKQATIIEVEASKYELSTSRATALKNIFIPMCERLEEFDEQVNDIVTRSESEITDELTAEAKKCRLAIRTIRTDTEKARKSQKEDIVAAGKAIDGIANCVKYAISGHEDKLEAIEKHFLRIEANRLTAIGTQRAEELDELDYDHEGKDLANMDDDVWAAVKSMAKNNYAKTKARIKKEAEDKATADAAQAVENKRIADENRKLREDAKAKADEQRLEDAERAAEQKKKDDDAAAVQKVKDDAAAAIQKEKDDEIARLKKIADDKAAAEKAIEDKKIHDAQALAKAGDAEKLEAFIDELMKLKVPDLDNAQLGFSIRDKLNDIWSLCKGNS